MRRTLTALTATALVLSACGGADTTRGASDVPTVTGDAGTDALGSDGSSSESAGSASATAATGEAPTAVPALEVETVTSGLEHTWDVGFLPDDELLVTERAGRLQRVAADGSTTQVQADLDDVYAQGEAWLMGLLVHPDFEQTRRFSTCMAHAEGGSPVDVRVVSWTLSPDGSSAERAAEPLLTGLPLNDSGRHSGCRLALGPDGELLVSTGDTADPDVPQDLSSLGGKTLRADLSTGEPLADAPLEDAPYVWSYGHRNLQGIAVRPGTDQVFTAEHGPDVDDEVNRIRAGGNYGWDPSQGGTVDTYDESVPMTDTERFPDAVPAVWASGDPTEAVSGAAFLEGERWGALDGAFAVAALKGERLLALQLDDAGELTRVVIPPELDGTQGRLRSVQPGPEGALYVTTDNGTDDAVLRVTPAS